MKKVWVNANGDIIRLISESEPLYYAQLGVNQHPALNNVVRILPQPLGYYQPRWNETNQVWEETIQGTNLPNITPDNEYSYRKDQTRIFLNMLLDEFNAGLESTTLPANVTRMVLEKFKYLLFLFRLGNITSAKLEAESLTVDAFLSQEQKDYFINRMQEFIYDIGIENRP